jgi:hypothetical protein
MNKGLIYLSIFIFGTLGSYIPTWFGADFFSAASIIGGTIGSFLGIWIAVKASNYF